MGSRNHARRLGQLVSVWSVVQGAAERFPAWPNPFNCKIKKQTTWQCGEYVIVDVELVLGCVAHFFFANFVPSVTEITRKFAGGSYRCGFFGTRGARSPIDIVWEGPQAGRVAGEMLRPFATGLFYWWAAETAWGALDLWQSLIYAEDAGKSTANSCLIPLGHGNVRFDDSQGSIPFPDALCQNDMNHQPFSATITSLLEKPWSSTMYGYLDARGSTNIDFHGELRTHPGNVQLAEIFLPNVQQGSIVPFVIEFESSQPAFGLGHRFWWTQDEILPLFPSEVVVTRWLAKQIV